MSTTETQAETDLLIKLMIEAGTDGWRLTTNLDDVPAQVGHYSLKDGLKQLGCGVTHDMQRSIRELLSKQTPKRPIFEWKPDGDGSAALWLDGKITCSRCHDKRIFDMWLIDQHRIHVHGDEPECECQ